MSRKKPSLLYKKMKNLGIYQQLLEPQKLVSTVWYSCVELDEALEVSERIDA